MVSREEEGGCEVEDDDGGGAKEKAGNAGFYSWGFGGNGVEIDGCDYLRDEKYAEVDKIGRGHLLVVIWGNLECLLLVLTCQILSSSFLAIYYGVIK